MTSTEPRLTTIDVVLVDDHTLVRKGIRSSLETDARVRVIGEGANGREAVELVQRLRPRVLIVDLAMPEMNGMEAVAEVTKRFPQTRCLVLSMHDNQEYVLGALEVGAHGYLLKDTSQEEFLHAIERLADGQTYFSPAVSGIIATGYLHRVTPQTTSSKAQLLSPRERDVLALIVDGKANREIADELGLSIRTVEVHRASIMRKLKVKNAVELVRMAMEEKLVDPTSRDS